MSSPQGQWRRNLQQECQQLHIHCFCVNFGRDQGHSLHVTHSRLESSCPGPALQIAISETRKPQQAENEMYFTNLLWLISSQLELNQLKYIGSITFDNKSITVPCSGGYGPSVAFLFIKWFCPLAAWLNGWPSVSRYYLWTENWNRYKICVRNIGCVYPV